MNKYASLFNSDEILGEKRMRVRDFLAISFMIFAFFFRCWEYDFSSLCRLSHIGFIFVCLFWIHLNRCRSFIGCHYRNFIIRTCLIFDRGSTQICGRGLFNHYLYYYRSFVWCTKNIGCCLRNGHFTFFFRVQICCLYTH